MPDTRILTLNKPILFDEDQFFAPKGALCTLIREQASGIDGAPLYLVMFVDGVKRFVKRADVEER